MGRLITLIILLTSGCSQNIDGPVSDAGATQDADTDSGATQDTDSGATQDADTDSGVTQDANTDSGVTQDANTDSGTTQDANTDGGVTQDANTDGGVTQDTGILDAGSNAGPDGGSPNCMSTSGTINTQADIAAIIDCVSLDDVYLHITSGVTNVSLPNLEEVRGYVYLHMNADTATVSMPVLRTVGGYIYFHQNPSLTLASFPSLETVGGYLYVNGNLSLTTLGLTQSLNSVADYTSIVGNTALCVPALDWPTITAGAVNISGNGMCP